MSAAKGIWQSIFYSVLGGYILLLCVVFAIPNAKDGSPDNAGVGAGGVAYIFTQSMGNHWAAFVLFISASAQVFCATSCMTSASRMTFAFSRDGAMPGSKHWRTLTAKRVPANAVMLVAVCCAIVTAPALIKVNIGTADAPLIIPVAFYAVTSIAVIGLYLAFAIPIYLRWRHGDSFEPGSWTNGPKYKWMNPIAVAEIVIVSIYLMLPFVPGANPFSDAFEWKFVNYAPVVTIGAVLILVVWWEASAKKWFKGPIRTLDLPAEGVLDRSLWHVEAADRGGGSPVGGGVSGGGKGQRRLGRRGHGGVGDAPRLSRKIVRQIGPDRGRNCLSILRRRQR
jgi:amino acid transporter